MEPGIYYGLPLEALIEEDAVSYSTLKNIAIAPSYLKWRKENPKEATPLMTMGSATQYLVTHSHVWEDRYRDTEVARRGTKAWKDAVEDAGDRICLTEGEIEKVFGMADSIRHCPDLLEFSLPRGTGVAETVVVWNDSTTGVKCKIALDWWWEEYNRIDEMKTTEKVGKDAFAKQVANQYWHVQAAMAVDAIATVTNQQWYPTFRWIGVERKPPHMLAVRRASKATIDLGRWQYTKWLRLYADCKESGLWPGYSTDGVEELELPSWEHWRSMQEDE